MAQNFLLAAFATPLMGFTPATEASALARKSMNRSEPELKSYLIFSVCVEPAASDFTKRAGTLFPSPYIELPAWTVPPQVFSVFRQSSRLALAAEARLTCAPKQKKSAQAKGMINRLLRGGD